VVGASKLYNPHLMSPQSHLCSGVDEPNFSSLARSLCMVLSASLGGIAVSGHCMQALQDRTPVPAQQLAKASSAQVGSAMAVLATLEQAQVLPPEGSPEANRIVQAAIQLQSAFTRRDDPAIQKFALRAVSARQGARADAVLEEAHNVGWTAEVLESLAEAEGHATEQELRTLKPGLGRYNMSVEEFQRFMYLVRAAGESLQEKGLDFQSVFAEHRRAMPEAGSPATHGSSGTAN